MSLPRRCKKCRCYVADHLTRCPRCNKSVPAVVKLTAAEQRVLNAERNAKEEAKLPVIHQKNIKWKPNEFSIRAHRDLEKEVLHRIKRADTARMRNTLRSELRLIRATLRRAEQTGPCWTREFQYDPQGAVSVFISPKGRRYVLAESDETATLIIRNRKGAAIPITRLVRYEQSNVFGRIKLEEKMAKQHHAKAKAKIKNKKAKQKAVEDATVDPDTLQ